MCWDRGMTTDQDLRQAILGDAGAEVRKRAEKRRRGRRRGGFARKIALKLLFLGLSLGASRYLIATEDGQATMARFQAGLLEVIETEMAARREAAMTAAAAVPAQAFAPVDTVEEAVAASAVDVASPRGSLRHLCFPCGCHLPPSCCAYSSAPSAGKK